MPHWSFKAAHLLRFLIVRHHRKAAVLVFLLCITGSLVQADTCSYTYSCSTSQCAAVMGGWSGTKTESGDKMNLASCETTRKQFIPGGSQPCTCTADGAAPGATGTGSLLGDALNLGANLWILQNVKNPYTAVFAQNFTQGFLKGLFGNNNPEAEHERQMADEAVRRQQQEAAERARAAEQQRLDAMFARLNTELKLSGSSTQLTLKTSGPRGDLPLKLSGSGSDDGLKLKLGNNSTSASGISRLPGTYVGGPPDTADMGGNSAGLKLKLGDSSTPPPPTAPTRASDQPANGMGIPGLPGIYLNAVEPAQAAQLANAATTLTGPERNTAEDAALQAAQKNPALTARSEDPFVTNYQQEAQGYDAAIKQQQEALQKASEAAGHVQADTAAIAYANPLVQSPNATDAQKQAFQEMQSAAQSDEDAAVAARQMFEQTDIHLSIARDRASDALAALAPPANLGASRNSGAPATIPAPSGHAVPSPLPATSSALPVLSPSSKPRILATRPTGGKPYVMSLSECVASYSPKGDVPTMDALQKKLESTMTAMERIAKSQENADDLEEDWSKVLRDAHKDIFNNVTDAALDGLLDLSMKSLEMDKELYHEALEASMKESQQLRAEYQAIKDNSSEIALWDAKKADYLARAQSQLGQRQVLEDDMAGVEKTKRILEKLQTGRDFKNWLTDNELIPCKFEKNGKINCDDNGGTKFARGDLNTQLDLLKQVVKFGMHYSRAFKALSYGSYIGETWDTLSFMSDTAYDGLAIAYSKQRLDQVKQNDAQLDRAREVLGDRIDRLNAEIGCYQGAN